MKRGLVTLDPLEIPTQELAGRVGRLQEGLRAQGVFAAALYGDVYRSGDLSYLSNICVYWNEGLLLVPAHGEPSFLTKLSARVHGWMRRTSNLSDLRSGGDLATLLAAALAGAPADAHRLGLVEMAWWPAQLLERIRATLPDWEIQDLGPSLRRFRHRPSPSETMLLRRGAAVTAEAVRAGAGPQWSLSERRGLAERSARLAGVEDVYVFCDFVGGEDAATGGAGASCLQVLSEFRGYWTQGARVLCPPAQAAPDSWYEGFHRAYVAAVDGLRPGIRACDLRSLARPIVEAAGLLDWSIDVISHVDLETEGDHRAPVERDLPLEEGAVVGVSLRADLGSGHVAVAADTFLMGDDRAERLTAALPEGAIWNC